MARHRRGGKHRRERRSGAVLPAAGGCALALAVTGALTMPADASDAAAVLASSQRTTTATSTASATPTATITPSRPTSSGEDVAVTARSEFTMSAAREAKEAADKAAVAAERARAERRVARARALARTYKRPTSGYRITAKFGSGGGYWSSGRHTGLDFATDSGRAVRAVTAGTVVQAGWEGAYGQQIVIKHADGMRTTYSHLSQMAVAKGDTVSPGQEIGAVGSTGNTTGPHLHLEVLKPDDTPIDPLAWLRKHGVRL